jgi:hypothetical protein
MNWGTVTVGFLSGLVSGLALIMGTVVLFFPKLNRKPAQEKIRDMSHFGRRLGRKNRHSSRSLGTRL